MNTETLSTEYKTLTPEARLERFFQDFADARIFVSTSLGTSSAILLHMLNKINPNQDVYFIDTGYHFPETLQYKQDLENLLNSSIKTIKPRDEYHKPTQNNFLWQVDPDFCCLANKVMPLQETLKNYDVWISGLMAHQNENRKSKGLFEQSNVLKFYPILDFPKDEADIYFQTNKLPTHPLKSKGYGSTGCFHCTLKGNGREGRWKGKVKTECGLHIS